MKSSDAIYLSGCVLLIVFALFYCAVPLFHINLPRYYPTLRQWKTNQEPGVPSMGWYGRTAFAFILSIPAGVFAFLIIKSRKGEMSNESIWFKLAGIAAILSLLLVMSYIVWHEYHVWILQ